MSKSDVIEVEGKVVEKLPNAMFKVELEKKDENLILLTYMHQHNEQHTAELEELYGTGRATVTYHSLINTKKWLGFVPTAASLLEQIPASLKNLFKRIILASFHSFPDTVFYYILF